MARFLRLGTATNIPIGPIVAVSDGYTYLATTITLAASAVQFNKGNAVSGWQTMASAAVSCPIPGWLSLPVPATDTNVVGPMNFNLGNVTGNLPVWTDCIVLAANVYDALLGVDFLDVNVTQLEGGAPSTVILTYFATGIAVQVVTGVLVATAVNAIVATGVLVATTVNANVLTITGGAVSNASIGSVANLATSVVVASIAAGVGVNVSSINAAVGVNVSSIAAGVGVNVSSMGVGVDVLTITGGAVSNASIGSVANLATGVVVASIAAGVGVNVSSINAAIGVNVSSINAGVGVNVSSMGVGVDVLTITGAAVSSAVIGAVFAGGVHVTSIAAGVGVNVSSMGVGVNVLTITGAAPSDAFLGYLATRIAVQVVTAIGVAIATTVNANVILITGSAVSDATIGSVANLATGVHVSSIAAGVGVNVSSVAAGVGVNVTSMAVGVNVTAIGGIAPTDVMFNANLVQCTGAAPSNAFPDYIWRRVFATPPGQTIEAGDYMKIIGAAVAGRCSGATSNPGLIVFYGPSGDAKVSGSFASGNRTGATWVT